MLDRLSQADRVSGIGAGLALVSTFLPWYHFDTTSAIRRPFVAIASARCIYTYVDPGTSPVNAEPKSRICADCENHFPLHLPRGHQLQRGRSDIRVETRPGRRA